MDQRRVRLGDVLDDYCPRERRVTNHAVVALVGDDIKLTRCTTCDTEHPYKGARVPPRRQRRLVAALSTAGADGALIAVPAPEAAPAPPPPAGRPLAAGSPASRPIAAAPPAAGSPAARPLAAGSPTSRPLAAAPPAAGPPASRPLAAGFPPVAFPAAVSPDAASPDVPLPAVSRPSQPAHVDSVRRPLIRATLGRPDPAAAARPAPVFTMREQEGRGGNVDRGNSSRRRRNGARPGAEPNGNRAEGYPGQFTRSGYGKNESKSARRNGNARPERFNKNNASRSRGKSRSR